MKRIVAVVFVCASCQYETRSVPNDVPADDDTSALEDSGATNPSLQPVTCSACEANATLLTCRSDDDCDRQQKCELTTECFRSCEADVCDSGCEGVCRSHGGKCTKSASVDSNDCEGVWHIPWDEEGCPRTPTCICPDGTARPEHGACSTTCDETTCAAGFCTSGGAACAAEHCALGQVALAGVDCCPVCIDACVGDDDCSANEHCVRENGCAVRECSDGNWWNGWTGCGNDDECYGICRAKP